MQDTIIKGNGNSRTLRSVGDFLSRFPDYESFAGAMAAGTVPIDLGGLVSDGCSQVGTPLDTAHLTEFVEEKVGAATEVFVATYGTTTSQEIEAAYQAGKVVVCYYDGDCFSIARRENEATFAFSSMIGPRLKYFVSVNSAWTPVAEMYLAPKESPELTGTPTAPTAAAGTNTTQIATTAFVQAAIGAAIGGSY